MTRRRGSSPLARGLLTVFAVIMTTARIIPARAGFTAPTGGCPARRWDHPRSRGVYADALPGGGVHGGSSPLARGLRRCAARRGRPWGIIPARAGFTRARRAGGRSWGDHPRSRGVYLGTPSASSRRMGSSPLARGLRTPPAGRSGHGGIIPARAGFTGSRVAFVARPGDHPRSRGVYPRRPATRSRREGSSPLARGLPHRRRGQRQGRRIIPARAGFTDGPHSTPGRGGDHPRSRGVYRSVFGAR